MIAENYKELKEGIAAAARSRGRSPEEIRLVTVTKMVGPAEIRASIRLGMNDFGENRLQEALPKFEEFPDVNWHFIGHLQSNKAYAVIRHCSLIHSLDRLSLARAIQRGGERLNRRVDCLVQVNISGEASKHGLAPEGLASFLKAVKNFSRIRVLGLMGMAPLVEDPEEARPYFRRLRELQQALATPEVDLKELSMGMTNDYRVAIQEGATMIRVGSALFKTNTTGR
ncbi:MAG: YggS family pyridoxal phosphate-dependent enzyme [Firmicutes bacterium]|nr:YggS family pyridoxal phosphate-dependent enzyme [Bacillota bacterium]